MHTPSHTPTALPPAAAFISWLEHALTQLEPGTRLAPHTQLARSWHISPVTLRKLLKPYQLRGSIVSVPGRGTCVGPLPDAGNAAQTPHPPSSHQSVVDAITQAIASGRIRRGEALPSIKQICVQHRVTPATVSKAYRTLVTRGRVQRVGKRYWVGGLQTSTRSAAGRFVYFFYHGGDSPASFLKSIQFAPAVAEMETELQSLQFRMLFLDARTELLPSLSRWRSLRDAPAGIVIAGEDATALENAAEQTGQFLSRRMLQRPRVLIAGARTRKRCRLPIYFTHGHIPTIKARTVIQFAEEQRFSRLDIVLDNPRPGDAVLRDTLRLFGEHRSLGAGIPLRFVAQRNAHVGVPEDLPRLLQSSWDQDYLRSISGRCGQEDLTSLAREVIVTESLAAWYRRAQSRPLWYFLDDREAMRALEQCRAANMSPPQCASLLCERDSPLCHQHGISACVTDWRTIGYLMAHALLGDIPIARTAKGYLRTNVRIFERLTTP